MIIIIVLSIVIVACLIWGSYDPYDDLEFTRGLIIIVSSILLFVFVLILGIYRGTFNAELAKLKAFEKTIATGRNIQNYENAAITAKIADWNEWIAENKYWNSTIMDICIPDKIENVEPIK